MAPLRSSEKYTQEFIFYYEYGKIMSWYVYIFLVYMINVYQCMPMLAMYANVYKGKIEPPSSAK